MAKCSYHPNIDTEMSCAECGKPICPKEMVLTPVGYKCPEHARLKRGQYTYVKPKQILFASLASLATGVGGAFLVASVRFGGLFVGVLWGLLSAEAVRRASGGHRGGLVGGIAAAGIALGWLAMAGNVSPITAIIALVAVLFQLAVFGK